ncbi:MAG: DUF3579 domain-containing protein [Gammaproteobacteria bacterium]
MQQVLIVRNHDQHGNKIRPSNWAERLAGNAASFSGGRMRFDARVAPCAACAGNICLRGDTSIREERPEVMANVVSFMRMYDLADYAHACPKVDSQDYVEPLMSRRVREDVLGAGEAAAA